MNVKIAVSVNKGSLYNGLIRLTTKEEIIEIPFIVNDIDWYQRIRPGRIDVIFFLEKQRLRIYGPYPGILDLVSERLKNVWEISNSLIHSNIVILERGINGITSIADISQTLIAEVEDNIVSSILNSPVIS